MATDPTGAASASAAATPSQADLVAGAERSSHFLDPTRFVETEATNQKLGAAVPPAPVEVPAAGVPRGGGPPTAAELGVLAQLAGTWMGKGFNLIARPDKEHNKAFFLELNATFETLEFTPISGPIPNRGSAQNDISFLGLTYLQRISDATAKGGLHIEPGIWLNVPPTSDPLAEASVVRLATIPHGNALLAQGRGFVVAGPPTISPVSSIPIDAATGKPVPLDGYTEPYIRPSPPPGIPPAAVINPNLVLTEAIKDQVANGQIKKTVVLLVATKPVGGIENIPFLVTNANAISMTAIFWIETIDLPGGGELLQLQYTQTVILNFDGINWPHISVATLLKF
jgi:hypothetical protein